MTKQTWVSTVSTIFQFMIGFVLGVTVIAGIGAGMAYWYFTKMSSHTPTRPVFEEETKPLPSSEKNAIAPGKSDATGIDSVQSEPTPEPEPIPEPEPEFPLPPNAYFARVTWPQGLSLRAEPASDAERIGGVGYNARIIILEDSSDRKWQRIRVPQTQQEAWVKAGNVAKE